MILGLYRSVSGSQQIQHVRLRHLPCVKQRRLPGFHRFQYQDQGLPAPAMRLRSELPVHKGQYSLRDATVGCFHKRQRNLFCLQCLLFKGRGFFRIAKSRDRKQCMHGKTALGAASNSLRPSMTKRPSVRRERDFSISRRRCLIFVF